MAISLLLLSINLICIRIAAQTLIKSCSPEKVFDSFACRTSCSAKKYIGKQYCLDTCPFNSKKLVTSLGKYCILENEFDCRREDCLNEYPYCYRQNCLSSCPEYTVEFNKTCVLTCPAEAPFLTAYDCEGVCLMGNKSCSAKCPLTHPYTFRTSSFIHCLSKCPQLFIVSVEDMSCKSTCPPSLPMYFNNTCYSECPETNKFISFEYSEFSEMSVCSDKCPNDKVMDGNICVEHCPRGKHLFNNTCLMKCPQLYQNLYSKSFSSRPDITNFGGADYMCVTECNQPNDHSYFLYGYSCYRQCPGNARFEFNSTCYDKCPNDFHFMEKTYRGTFKCVDNCKDLYYTDTCVTECPSNARYTSNVSCVSECTGSIPYKFNALTKSKIWQYDDVYSYICVQSCPQNSLIYDNETCVSVCPADKKYELNGTCHIKCPDTHIYRKPKGKHFECLENCSNMLVFDNTCVNSCPAEAKYQSNKSCVSTCENERPYIFQNFTKTWSKTTFYHYCFQSCPSDMYDFDHDCVRLCPKNTFMFNYTCAYSCPTSHVTNYTRNRKGYGGYECVDNCPTNTYVYNETCFDRCPSFLKSHKMTCTKSCPNTHPYTNTLTRRCMDKCPYSMVMNDYFCENKCPKSKPYIEDTTCVTKCLEPKTLYAITNQGKQCYSKCPNHLFLLENHSVCIKTCPAQRLIVNGICKKLDVCPSHKYIEHSNLGRRCTNICSKEFYLDDTHCVKECPPQKVILEMTCMDTCPESHPLSHKTYTSSKPRVTCYKQCPDLYLANGTDCIEEYSCEFYKYDHVCYKTCPAFTVTSGNNECESMIDFIITAAVCVVLTVISILVIFVLLFYIGSSGPITKEDNVYESQDLTTTNDHDNGSHLSVSIDKNESYKEDVQQFNDQPTNEEEIELNDGYQTYSKHRKTTSHLEQDYFPMNHINIGERNEVLHVEVKT